MENMSWWRETGFVMRIIDGHYSTMYVTVTSFTKYIYTGLCRWIDN